MKNYSTFVWSLCVLMFPISAAARQHRPGRLAVEDIPYSQVKNSASLRQITPAVAQKTNGTGSRMTSYYYGRSDGQGGYSNSDSSAYHYPGISTNNIDVMLDFAWDGMSYTNNRRTLIIYNAQNQETQEIQQYWNGSAWNDVNKITFSYDANGRYSQLLVLQWNTNSWENYYRYKYSYNTSGKPTQLIIEYWDAVFATWIVETGYFLDYDAAGNNTQYQMYSWNDNTNKWTNYIRYIDRFNANNHRISSVFQYGNSDTTWETIDSISFSSLNAAGLPLAAITSDWDGFSWSKYSRETITYTAANNERTYLLELWNGAGYNNDERRISDYNGYDQITSVSTQSSDGASGWIIDYDDYSERYHYEPYTTTGISEVSHTGLQLYPNPAGPDLCLAFSEKPKTQPVVTIYSATGQLVATKILPEQQQVTVDIRDLPVGIYVLALREAGGTEYFRFIKR